MRLLIGITGASGSVYGLRLIKHLSQCNKVELFITATKTGIKVCSFETKIDILSMAKELNISFFDIDDLFAPPSSGSFGLDGTVILPCSMGSIGRIASGISSNLLERASDVMLKERKQLIICPRETPLNSIHLENMLKLSRTGVNIVPVSTAFYYSPKTIDDIIDFHIGKVLDILGISHRLFQRWGAL